MGGKNVSLFWFTAPGARHGGLGSGGQRDQAAPHSALRGLPAQRRIRVARVLVLPHDTHEHLSRPRGVAKGG